MRKIFYVGNFNLKRDNAALIRITNNIALIEDENVETIVFGFDLSETIKNEYKHITFVSTKKPANLFEWINYSNNINHKINMTKNNCSVIIFYNCPTLIMKKITKHNKENLLLGDITEWYEYKWNSFKNIIKIIDTNYRMRILNRKLDGLILVSTFLERYYEDVANKVVIPTLIDYVEDSKNMSQRNKNNFIYAGNPESKDKLDIFIKGFIKYLNEYPNSNLYLDIYGITSLEYSQLYNDSAFTSVKNIKFHGYKNNSEIIKITNKSNYGFLLREQNKRNNAGFPTKFSEFVTLDIPIIYNNFSDLEMYVNNQSVLINTIDKNSIYNAIKEIVQNDIKRNQINRVLTVNNKLFIKRFNDIININKLEI